MRKWKKKKTYRAKQKSFAIQVLPQRLGIHSTSLSSLVLLGSCYNHSTGRGLLAPITIQIFIPWGWISPRLAPRHTWLERGRLTRAATVPGHTCVLLFASFLFHGSATHPFQDRLPLKRTALATRVRKREIKVGVLGKASWNNRNFWLPFSRNSFQKHSWCMAKCWCRQWHLKWEGWYLKKNPLSCWH